MSDPSAIPVALRCPACDGNGEVDSRTRAPWHDARDTPERDWTECRYCGGEGRRWCDLCGFDDKPKHAVLLVMDGKAKNYLCLDCHAEWTAESARMRAEKLMWEKLHDETMRKLEGAK